MANKNAVKTPEPLVRPYRYKPEVTVAARPIDTDVRAQYKQVGPPVGYTPLQSLANSLREVSPTLIKFYTDKQTEKHNNDLALGERLQKENNAAQWQDFISKNPQYEKYSPYVREGFEKQLAISKGLEFTSQLKETMQNDQSIAGITDPAQIQAYIHQKRQTYMNDNLKGINDRAIQQAFLPISNDTQARLATAFVDKQLTDQQKEKMSVYSDNLNNIVLKGLQDNLSVLQSGDAKAIEGMTAQMSAGVSNMANNTILDVTNPRSVNDATFSALCQAYKDTNVLYRPVIRKIMEGVTGYQGAKLLDIPRYRDAFNTVMKSATDEALDAEKTQIQMQEIQDKKQENAAFREYGPKILTDPTNSYKYVTEATQKYGVSAGEAVQSLFTKSFGAYRSVVSAGHADASWATRGSRGRRTGAAAISAGNGLFGDTNIEYGVIPVNDKLSALTAVMEGTITATQIKQAAQNKWLTATQASAAFSNLGKPQREVNKLINDLGAAVIGRTGDPQNINYKFKVQSAKVNIGAAYLDMFADFFASNKRMPTYSETVEMVQEAAKLTKVRYEAASLRDRAETSTPSPTAANKPQAPARTDLYYGLRPTTVGNFNKHIKILQTKPANSQLKKAYEAAISSKTRRFDGTFLEFLEGYKTYSGLTQ